MKTYTVLIEQTSTGYGASVPDLPGCIATGPTREHVLVDITDALLLQIEGLREDGLDVPEPTTTAETISIAV